MCKAGSFDTVTCEKFYFMVAISAGIAVNWGKEVVVMTKQTALQRLTFVRQGIFSRVQILERDWVTFFLPKIDPASKGKETLVVMNNPTPVEEHCQLVLNSAWADVCTRMDTFDEWMHFQKEVRLKDVSSFDHLTQIEEQLLCWAETDQVSKLFEQRSLIMFKLYELELQKSIAEHVAKFKTTEHSVNHDYMCIRLLRKELREIAWLNKAQRILAGLPIEAPEASIPGDDVGSTSLQLTWSSMAQSQIPALEFSTQKEQEQEVNKKLAQRVERIEEIVRTVENVDSTETDSKQGQLDPDELHLDQGQQHQAHGDQDTVQQNFLTDEHQHQGSTNNPTQLDDPSANIANIVSNLGPDPTQEDNNVDHQVPPDSPHANSKIDEVDKAVASIDSRIIYMESKITSLDSRTLSIDSKMHSMEAKIRSMNSNIEQLMDTQKSLKLDFGRQKHIVYEKVDKLAENVTSSQTALETSIIRQLAGQQHQLTTDLDMVKLQLSELVEHLKRVGDAKKGEGGQSRPVEGSIRLGGEGPSGGKSIIRGRGPSPRGGRGQSPGRYRPSEDSERFRTNHLRNLWCADRSTGCQSCKYKFKDAYLDKLRKIEDRKVLHQKARKQWFTALRIAQITRLAGVMNNQLEYRLRKPAQSIKTFWNQIGRPAKLKLIESCSFRIKISLLHETAVDTENLPSCTVHRGFSDDFSLIPVIVFTIEVALDSSQEALSSYTSIGGCGWLVVEREVAALFLCCVVQGLFDRVQYDDDLRLSLVTLFLRKAAERWWRGASSTLLETDVAISWGSFCETFQQEYVPESYVNAREWEFDHLEYGSMSVREYARTFSSLLAYVPHIYGR
ncbi:hypothetical protein F511_06190 [Dorcoceras hygrometricum]|uniref:Retrotransposon gag domain-containing protein n=1 Tax=Dorcoceras hygrometricum TaxID=472368 RepID=A0A2Z7CJ14_9LAMI|nr:hypothetical protein F511_06190 [Dorcoceras hygrometricum]